MPYSSEKSAIRILRGGAIAAPILLLLAACGAAPSESESTAGSSLATNSDCNSTAATFELRAFIPPGPLDGYTDVHGNGCPDEQQGDIPPRDWGFPEPSELGAPIPTLFHGDHRNFSPVWNASSRQIAIINVAMQAPNTCRQNLGTMANIPGVSHRCWHKPAILGLGYVAESAQATIVEENVAQSCQCKTWRGDYEISSKYPLGLLAALSPAIYDDLSVTSRATVDARDDQGRITKQTQHFTVTATHTPFPFHEVVVRYACGKKTKLLTTFTSPFQGPGPWDLGPDHKSDSSEAASFSLSINPTLPNGVQEGK